MAKAKRKTAGELPAEVVEQIQADLERYRPGLWAEEVAPGPACRCGRRRNAWKAEGGGIDDGKCYRHPEVNNAVAGR